MGENYLWVGILNKKKKVTCAHCTATDKVRHEPGYKNHNQWMSESKYTHWMNQHAVWHIVSTRGWTVCEWAIMRDLTESVTYKEISLGGAHRHVHTTYLVVSPYIRLSLLAIVGLSFPGRKGSFSKYHLSNITCQDTFLRVTSRQLL